MRHCLINFFGKISLGVIPNKLHDIGCDQQLLFLTLRSSVHILKGGVFLGIYLRKIRKAY